MHPIFGRIAGWVFIPPVVGRWLVTFGTIGPPSAVRTIALVIGCILFLVPVAVLIHLYRSTQSCPKPSYAEAVRYAPTFSALVAWSLSFGMVVEVWIREAPKIILLAGSPELAAAYLACVAVCIFTPVYWLFRWTLPRRLRKVLGAGPDASRCRTIDAASSPAPR
jgi:hypothetical protein